MSAFQPSATRYRDPRAVARIAIAGLIVAASLAVIVAATIVTGLAADTPVIFSVTGRGFEGPTGMQAAQRIAPLVSVLSYSTWLVWQYRVHTNARVIAPGTVSTSPAWGVLCWFVPFLNFVKPFQVIREIQRASSIGGSRAERWVAWLWWVCWIGAFVAVTVVITGFMLDFFDAVERSRDEPRLVIELSSLTLRSYVVTEVLLVAAAALAMVIVRGITQGQVAHRPASPTGSIDEGSPDPPARPDL